MGVALGLRRGSEAAHEKKNGRTATLSPFPPSPSLLIAVWPLCAVVHGAQHTSTLSRGVRFISRSLISESICKSTGRWRKLRLGSMGPTDTTVVRMVPAMRPDPLQQKTQRCG